MDTRAEMHRLVQNILSSHEERTTHINGLREDAAGCRQVAQSQLDDWRKGRQASSARQRNTLTRGRVSLAKGEASRKSDVSKSLKQQATARRSQAQRQHAALTKVRTVLAQDEATRKSKCSSSLRQMADARTETQREWRGMTATIPAKRIQPSAKVSASSSPEAQTQSKVLEAPGKRVFEHLANRPDGTRLAELQVEFGMNRFAAARVVRGLIDTGKVEKRGLLYFAV